MFRAPPIIIHALSHFPKKFYSAHIAAPIAIPVIICTCVKPPHCRTTSDSLRRLKRLSCSPSDCPQCSSSMPSLTVRFQPQCNEQRFAAPFETDINGAARLCSWHKYPLPCAAQRRVRGVVCGAADDTQSAVAACCCRLQMCLLQPLTRSQTQPEVECDAPLLIGRMQVSSLDQ